MGTEGFFVDVHLKDLTSIIDADRNGEAEGRIVFAPAGEAV